jgi:molecular chaperone GrpE
MNEHNGEEIEPTSANPDSDPSAEGAASTSDALAEAKAEAARMKDQWMRMTADFDNFRKRTRREIEDARKGGREDLLKDILPVFDNLERAIQSAQSATDVKPVVEGLTLILRQLLDTLARTGITRVPSVGQRFDPAIHDAIQQLETDDHPGGTVIAEVQSGYVQGDRLVRAAMVVVSKPKSEGKKSDAEPSEASE